MHCRSLLVITAVRTGLNQYSSTAKHLLRGDTVVRLEAEVRFLVGRMLLITAVTADGIVVIEDLVEQVCDVFFVESIL